jgi:penicillin-binding protein 1A
MRQALAGVPVQPAGDPPPGVLSVGGDWTYSEWADGGNVQRIGFDDAVPASK